MSKHLQFGLIATSTLLCTLVATPDALGQASGFTIQPFEPPLAPDRFFATPDATAKGHLTPAAQLVGHWAYKPLLTRTNERTGDTVELLSSQFYVFLGGSLSLEDLVLVAVDIPIAVAQSSHDPLDAGTAFGDVRLSGRFAAYHFEPVDLGLQLDFWLPTGSEDNLTGDGAPRMLPQAIASGRVDAFIYSGSLGYLIRDREESASLKVGPAFAFSLAAGVLLLDDMLQAGGELTGSSVLGSGASLFDDLTSPISALIGGKFRYEEWAFGLAGGPSLTEAPGNAPRILLSAAYVPQAKRTEPASP